MANFFFFSKSNLLHMAIFKEKELNRIIISKYYGAYGIEENIYAENGVFRWKKPWKSRYRQFDYAHIGFAF